MTSRHRLRCVYAIALIVLVPDPGSAGPSAPKMSPDPSLVFIGNPQKGAAVFQNRCSACHSVQETAPAKIGPPLHGLLGRQAGTVPGYNYSADMRASRIIWNAQTLDAYLADPHRGIPSATMPYQGLSSKTARDDLISFLEQATR